MVNGSAVPEYDPTRGSATNGYSAHHWLYAYQNDSAARADWCVSDYNTSNHQPIVTVEEWNFDVAAGSVVTLKGNAVDPDGDTVQGNWFVYTEACQYQGGSAAVMDVWQHDTLETSFTVPVDAQPGDMFNLVLEVTDNGIPALTRYAQVIVHVTEAAPQPEDNAGGWQS